MQPSITHDKKSDGEGDVMTVQYQIDLAEERESSIGQSANEADDHSTSFKSNQDQGSISSIKDNPSNHEHQFKSIAQAQDQLQKQADQSPSESTNSGVVSPSSCSVSSQDSLNTKNHAGLEEEKHNVEVAVKTAVNSEKAEKSKEFEPSSEVSSRPNEASQPAPVTSSTITKPPRPRQTLSKPTKPKSSSSKRPTSRKRSNSVPMYSATDSKSFGIADLPASSMKGSQLRRGKWTVEEETYVARVIHDFNNGFLDAPAGTTLRTYLSDKLNCDPMRITKKFTGDSCIGKRVFHPAARCATNAAVIDKAQSELETLERRWRKRLEMQQKEADKKQAASVAASAAAAAAAAASAPHLHDPTSALIRLNASALPGNRVVVTRTASWLDRANAILSNRRMANEQLSKQLGRRDEVKKEMQEVKKLIQEGPIIQKSSELLRQDNNKIDTDADAEAPSKRKVSDDRDEKRSSSSANINLPAVTQKRTSAKDVVKRMRKSVSHNNLEHTSSAQIRADFNLSTGEAEDAASFLGFISSVREEAASGASPKKK